MFNNKVIIVGGGLAGCECATILAKNGIESVLFEMKPQKFSEAHVNSNLAELVCSNSFRSNSEDSAIGILKQELRLLGSTCMHVAELTKVPSGKALAVDRDEFSLQLTKIIENEPLITVVREEVTDISPSNSCFSNSKVVVAAGPLASKSIVDSLQSITGVDDLYFFDAIAPVIERDSVDMSIAFWGERYNQDSYDYLNCPMTEEEYSYFYEELIKGDTVKPHNFEQEVYFEGCMPIEALAERGKMTLTFGSFKPVGFIDPRTGKQPYALVQLRPENLNKTMLNLVGCQTKLTYPEQSRIFKLIPGLQNAEFVRFGSMHRNTFVNAPKVLNGDGFLQKAPNIMLSGQITGVEGYVESIASGLWSGLKLSSIIKNKELLLPPKETALGALIAHTQTQASKYQPSNVQFGLMPELQERAKKKDRKILYAKRAESYFSNWLLASNINSLKN